MDEAAVEDEGGRDEAERGLEVDVCLTSSLVWILARRRVQ